MVGVKRKCNYVTKDYGTLYLNYSAYYTRTTQNYKYCYTKLQTILQKITISYRQNYAYMQYTQVK